MNSNGTTKARVINGWPTFLIWAVVCITILVSCSTSNTPTPQTSSFAAVGAATPISSPIDSKATSNVTPANTAIPGAPTLMTRAQQSATDEAAATSIARNASAVNTRAALTPEHPYTPHALETRSPAPPTATWGVRYGGWIMPENSFNPEYVSCWYGYLSNNLVSVCAGHEQRGGNPNQGVVRIKEFEPDHRTNISEDIYETPEIVGVVHIVVADSNSVTVASEDSQHVFTFDIATRQWVPNPPLPSPSLPPVPTLTTVP